MWAERLRGGRGTGAVRGRVDELWAYALGLVEGKQRDLCAVVGREPVEPVERGEHVEDWPALWDEMTMVRRSIPGAAWSTGSAGLGAPRPDPRPGDSRHLTGGPRRHPRRRGLRRACPRRVHADVPRLPRARGHARPDGRGDPRSRRRTGGRGRGRGAWTSERITPRAARSSARPASPRRARAPLGGIQLVDVKRGAFRCPYCGSNETRLETCSARRRAARSATARPAASRSSSSRRSRAFHFSGFLGRPAQQAALAGGPSSDSRSACRHGTGGLPGQLEGDPRDGVGQWIRDPDGSIADGQAQGPPVECDRLSALARSLRCRSR